MRTKSMTAVGSLVAAAGFLIAPPLFAGRIHDRAESQQHRIVQGVRSGELTAREMVKIELQEVKLSRQVRSMHENGLSPIERARIERKQDLLSKEILRQKNDRQNR